MTNDALSQTKVPAIGLILIGSINALCGLLMLLSGLLRLIGKVDDQIPTDEAQRLGYYMGTGFGYGLGFFSLILAPVIIYGGFCMLKGQKPGLAKTAAILAILPVSSCCFLLGIPFGIWALIVLRKPEVKAVFENQTNNRFYPPPPQ
ncbi:MAG: hypothetical protein LUM44_14330 [Pyrinomonadaceae bacterium]|nr:hypothetical protein [Pyrinomonadaceae bacterium]